MDSTVVALAVTKSGDIVCRKINVSAQEQQIGEGACVEAVVQNRKVNDSGAVNVNVVLVGMAGNQAYELQPGEHTPRIPVRNLDVLYARQQ